MIGESRGAEVIEIMPDHYSGSVKILGWIRVKDDTGQDHLFVNGSLNGIKWDSRRVAPVEVGMRGIIEFDKGPNFAFWFWKG